MAAGKRGIDLDRKMTEKKAEILAALKAHPGGLSASEIGVLIGKSTDAARQRLNYISLSAPVYDHGGRYYLLDRSAL